METNSYSPRAGKLDLSVAFTNVMTGVYVYMFLGLVVTASAAFMAYTNNDFVLALISSPPLFYGLLIGELLLVILLSACVAKLSFVVSFSLFMLYSLVNGLTLSVVFLVYTAASVYAAFFVAALTFGFMSVIGYFTKKDLTSVGHYCMMGLIGIIIAGIVNIFILNDTFSFVISVAGLLVFIGLTAYDTQKIKKRLESECDTVLVNKIAIWGALTLYLDFINIFLKLLRIMGKRK